MRGLFLIVVLFALGCGRLEKVEPTSPTPVSPVVVTPANDRPKTTSADPTDNWTHKELAACLEQRGVKVEVKGQPNFARQDLPASHFVDTQQAASDTEKPAMILVYLCKDSHAAIEQAGSMAKDSFAYRRFALGPSPYAFSPEQKKKSLDLLARIRAALD